MAGGCAEVDLPLVFRDYVVLLATNRATADIYQAMLEPLGFYRVVDIHQGQKTLSMARKVRPQLVVASTGLSIFSGPQILTAAREDPELSELPFLIVGVREDEKPGGLADQIKKDCCAGFVGLPVKPRQFCQAVVDLMRPFIDPKHEQALALMDQAAGEVKEGDLTAAAADYHQATMLNPEHLGGWLNLAAVQADLERFDGAEEAYLRALELDPYSLVAYFGLAELYERRGDFEHTIGVLRQALGVANIMKASNNSISRINFFIGEFELRLKRLLKAKGSFENAIERNPDDAVLRADIGDAYMEKGYLAESEEHYQASLRIDPNQAHIFNRLGIAYRRQKKYNRALKLYDTARSYHPRDENLLFNAARAHLEAERKLEAAALLDQALDLAPKFKAASYLLRLAEEGKTWSRSDLEKLRDQDSAKLWRRDIDD